MLRRTALILCLASALLAALPALGQAKSAVHRAGIFKLSLPAKWTRMPKAALEEWKKTMVSGGRELAEASQSADPNQFSEKSIPFLAGFMRPAGNKPIRLVFSGMTSPVKLNRQEMYKTNQERVQWGIKTGRLKAASKGMSKLKIDGVPCLLQDVETRLGQRMKVYYFFVPQRPKMAYGMVFLCDAAATFDRYAGEVSAIVKSIKVVRKKRK
ncbi:MAG: hypothetical protein C4525_13740 [Desulfarculus sp.]|jgi:hypothetical protein|nr:MAG: hypothetical protein C4525_13740 [Desulfarculus sp.]